MATIGRGWGDSDICSVVTNELVFSDTGFIVNEYTGLEAKDNVSVEATFVYNGIDIGLVLWYNNEIGYIKYLLTPQGFSIIRQYKGNEVPLRMARLADMPDITAPVADDTVTLKAELNRTNIKCYYNGTRVLNIEQNTFNSGIFGIYGTADAKCTAFTASTNGMSEWSTYLGDGAIIPGIGEATIISTGTSTYIYQQVTTVAGQKYTVSVANTGEVDISIYDGATELGGQTFTDDGVSSITFTATGTATDIRVGRSSEGTTVISMPQVEHKDFMTSYTEEAREDGYVSFPTGNMDQYQGGIALWIKPSHAYATGTLPIFYYNDTLKMVYTGGNFVLTYGAETLSMAYTIVAGEWLHVAATWDNGTDKKLYINVYDGVGDTSANKSITSQSIDHADYLLIGGTLSDGELDLVGNLTVDTLVVYTSKISIDTMKSFKTEPIPEDNNIVIKTDFSNQTLEFSRNKITVPNPLPFTPIVIEDSDGRVYDRVYFLNNGEYVVYNKQKFACTGSKTFTIDYDNVIDVKAVDNNSNSYSDILVNGSSITVNDLQDTATEVTIQYTPKDVFCAGYNKETNGYEIRFSNLYGKPITITYENDFGATTKFVTSVEANPFKSANNNGFMYVTQTPVAVTSLDVKITPDALVADGYQVATITIDCIGKNGVPTSNADLSISPVRYGVLTKYVSDEEQAFIDAFETEKALNGEDAAIAKYGNFVTDEHMSGRYIYKYKVNNIAIDGEYTEKIVVVDNKSGIGTEVPIRIVSKS